MKRKLYIIIALLLLPMFATAQEKPVQVPTPCLAGQPFTIKIPVKFPAEVTLVEYAWYRNDTLIKGTQKLLMPNEKAISYTVPDTAAYGENVVFHFMYRLDDDMHCWTASRKYMVTFWNDPCDMRHGEIGAVNCYLTAGKLGLTKCALTSGTVGFSQCVLTSGPVGFSQCVLTSGTVGFSQCALTSGTVGLSQCTLTSGTVGFSQCTLTSGTVGFSQCEPTAGAVGFSQCEPAAGTVGFSQCELTAGTVGLVYK